MNINPRKTKSLAPQEIENLHRFVRKHYVEYYDVELELVDHLANGIEEQWQADAELPFEEALQREFKKFGVFGFSDVVERKEKHLMRAYYGRVFQELQSFFSFPKIAGTFALFLLLFTGLNRLDEQGLSAVQNGVFLLGLSLIGYQVYRIYKRRKKEKTEGEKKWLLHQVLYHLEYWPYYLITFVILRIGFERFGREAEVLPSSGYLLFLSGLSTLIILYVYVLKRMIIPKLITELEAQKRQSQILSNK